MRRAGVSIPSNIAEGFSRGGGPEYRHFLHISLGSCAELETQVEVSLMLGFLAPRVHAELIEKLDHETGMLKNLVKRIDQRADA
jgi:four helix bundle protein